METVHNNMVYGKKRKKRRRAMTRANPMARRKRGAIAATVAKGG